MHVKRFLKVAIALLYMLGVSGCGNDSSDGVSYFNTVTATATVDTAKNPLLADVAKWTGPPCANGSTIAVKNDLVNFTIVSTKNSSSGTALPLMLQSATITFTPADTLTPAFISPSIYSPAYQNLVGYIIPGGGSLSVPVEVVTHSLKEFFLPQFVSPTSPFACTGNAFIYNYNATITFNAIEQGTGKSGQITAAMTVRFADFSD